MQALHDLYRKEILTMSEKLKEMLNGDMTKQNYMHLLNKTCFQKKNKHLLCREPLTNDEYKIAFNRIAMGLEYEELGNFLELSVVCSKEQLPKLLKFLANSYVHSYSELGKTWWETAVNRIEYQFVKYRCAELLDREEYASLMNEIFSAV